jgi:ribosomal 50S subunit-associated protein YjgA (DUF615 family)
MDPLAKAYLKRQHQKAERRQLQKLCRDLREKQQKVEPLRRAYLDRIKAGIKGDGFVMRPVD